MANPKAALVVYARLPNKGWRRGSVIIENGEPKLGYMVINKVEYAVDPIYQIRRYRDGKAFYDTVGSDYEAAAEKLERYYLSRQRDELDRKLGIHKPTQQANPDTLEMLVNKYLERKKRPSLDLSPTTIRHYQDALLGFPSMTEPVSFEKSVTSEMFALFNC